MSLKNLVAIVGSVAALGLGSANNLNTQPYTVDKPESKLEYRAEEKDKLILESLVENFDAGKKTAITGIDSCDEPYKYQLRFKNGERLVEANYIFVPESDDYAIKVPKGAQNESYRPGITIGLHPSSLEPINEITLNDKKKLAKEAYKFGSDNVFLPAYLLKDDCEPAFVNFIKEMMGENLVVMPKDEFLKFAEQEYKKNEHVSFDIINWEFENDKKNNTVSVTFSYSPYYLWKGGVMLHGGYTTMTFFKIKNTNRWQMSSRAIGAMS